MREAQMSDPDNATDDDASAPQTSEDDDQAATTDEILSPREGHIKEADAQLEQSRDDVDEASQARDTLDQ
jgi:hypothetical protein